MLQKAGCLCNNSFFFFFFRLEAVRIETRGERKEFAKTLMAKGMMHRKNKEMTRK